MARKAVLDVLINATLNIKKKVKDRGFQYGSKVHNARIPGLGGPPGASSLSSLAGISRKMQEIFDDMMMLKRVIAVNNVNLRSSFGEMRKFIQLQGALLVKLGNRAERLQSIHVMISRMKSPVSRLGQAFKRLGARVSALSDEWQKMAPKIRSIARSFSFAANNINQMAMSILGPLGRGLQVFLEYDRSIAQMEFSLRALGTFTEEAMTGLSDAITDVAKSSEFAQRELAAAAAQFVTAGVAADETAAILDDMALLARANFTTLDQIAGTTVKIMRRFGLSVEDAASEMWRLTKVAQFTDENILAVANSMGYAAGIGETLEFTFQEMAASMTILTQKYGSASIAGRRLANVYSRLIENGEEYGIQIRDMTGGMLSQEQQIGNLSDMLDLVGDSVEQGQFLMQMFGSSGASAAKTLVDAWRSGDLAKIMQEAGDSAEESLGTIAENMDHTYLVVQSMNSALQDLSMAFGEDLADTLSTLAKDLTNVIEGFQEFLEVNDGLITLVGSFAVVGLAAGALLAIIGMLMEIFAALAYVVGALGSALTAIGTFFEALALVGVTTAPALGAILIVLVAIVAIILLLVGLVYGVIKGFTDMAKRIGFLNPLLEFLANIFSVIVKLGQIIVGIIVLIAAGIFKIGQIIGEVIGAFVALVAEVFLITDVLGFFNKIANDTIKILDGFLGGITDVLNSLLPHSPTLADRFFELGQAVSSTLDPMKQATMWGRRLTNAVGDVNSDMTMRMSAGISSAINDSAGGVGGGRGIQINVDGAYIQDPEELGRIIGREILTAKTKSYRSGPF